MMQETFEKLRSLQEILSQKYEIEKEIHEIPKALTTKQELLNRLKKSYVERNQQIEETKTRIRGLRNKLGDAERQREEYEKQMDVIKTQREYEALDKEIKDATEKEQQFRKDILREEKELEELTLILEREEAMIKQQEEEIETEQKRIEENSQEKRETLTSLEKDEKNITPGIDEDILFKFERIIRSKSGVGIVPIQKSVCTGCHMILPDQFENDVRASEEILFCPYCSRILYWEGGESDEDIDFNMDDTGSLADLADLDDLDEEE